MANQDVIPLIAIQMALSGGVSSYVLSITHIFSAGNA